MLVDWVYEDVRQIFDSIFITSINSKYGIIDLAKDKILEPQFQSIDYHYRSQYIEAWKNNKVGVLNFDYETIIPSEYNAFYLRQNGINTEFKGHYLIAKKGIYRSLFKLDGTPVIGSEVNYIDIEPAWLERNCEDSKVYFKAAKKEKMYGLLDEQQKVVIPLKYNSVYVLSVELDACNQASRPVVIITKGDKRQAYDIELGLFTKQYDELQFFDGLYVYKDETGCGNLDEK
ncbi:MAG: hypothetical protein HRT57_16665 [Crocinitomicaceae bacterium]|nr:hypothetical protein [Crocinitomicaceae bacterium]